jgi:hypothetical protein
MVLFIHREVKMKLPARAGIILAEHGCSSEGLSCLGGFSRPGFALRPWAVMFNLIQFRKIMKRKERKEAPSSQSHILCSGSYRLEQGEKLDQ